MQPSLGVLSPIFNGFSFFAFLITRKCLCDNKHPIRVSQYTPRTKTFNSVYEKYLYYKDFVSITEIPFNKYLSNNVLILWCGCRYDPGTCGHNNIDLFFLDDMYGYTGNIRSWGYALPEATRFILTTYKGKKLEAKCRECSGTLFEVIGMCSSKMQICNAGHLRDAYKN